MQIETQRSIFDTFHDGYVTGAERNGNNILIQITIPYLAQVISRRYKFFYLDLINCEHFSFFEFYLDKEIVDLNEISKESPEILNCNREKNDSIEVFCSMGILKFKADDIIIYDHKKEKLIKEFLFMTADEYWNKSR